MAKWSFLFLLYVLFALMQKEPKRSRAHPNRSARWAPSAQQHSAFWLGPTDRLCSLVVSFPALGIGSKEVIMRCWAEKRQALYLPPEP